MHLQSSAFAQAKSVSVYIQSNITAIIRMTVMLLLQLMKNIANLYSEKDSCTEVQLRLNSTTIRAKLEYLRGKGHSQTIFTPS